MSTHQVFNGVDETVKAQLEAYWAKKLPRLEKLLVHYPDDLREIRLTISYHPRSSPKPSFYEADGVVQLPPGTLVAEANDRDAHVTLDLIADTLVKEIKRHNERVRRDYVFKRKSQQRTARGAADGMSSAAVKRQVAADLPVGRQMPSDGRKSAGRAKSTARSKRRSKGVGSDD